MAVMTRLVPALALLGTVWISISAPTTISADAPTTIAEPVPTDTCIPAAKCCKVCEAGQACGNTCISASKNCHKGRGCACNASEVCGRQ